MFAGYMTRSTTVSLLAMALSCYDDVVDTKVKGISGWRCENHDQRYQPLKHIWPKRRSKRLGISPEPCPGEYALSK